jgi:RimJ/RimL family protein N-acetyltransferase
MIDDLEIRYSELEDEPHLHRWLTEPDIGKWYPPGNELELKNFVSNWISYSKLKCSLTAVQKNEVCGIGTLFLMPYKKVSHHCLFYMVIDPEKTKNGLGEALLKNVLNLAENYFHLEGICAEVFSGSPIIKLLEKFDFEIYAVQKNYIKNDNGYQDRVQYQHFFKREAL